MIHRWIPNNGLVVFYPVLVLQLLASHGLISAYDPTWESLDSRPLPSWYDEAKFGIFIHWGVFSVPSYGNEWFWYRFRHDQHPDYVNFVSRTERPGFAYEEYAPRFTADLYNANEWVKLFAESGAQYVVLTSKHHEGYCNWDARNLTSSWHWNSMDIGSHRDLVGELAHAMKHSGIASKQTNNTLRFGLYHSLMEWFHPMFQNDVQNNYTTTVFPDTKILPEWYNLVNQYEPELLWSDGEWGGNSITYWKSTSFLAWYATNSSVAKTAVWNDRWGSDTSCKHGSFYNCEDRFRPNVLVEHKWEDCISIDKTSWGFNRNSTFSQYMTVQELVYLLVQTVALGGNLLLNIGPHADGTIAPIFSDRLHGIGNWLSVNGDAIYGTKPWKICQNETNVYYTTKNNTLLYVHITKWPLSGFLHLTAPIPTSTTVIRMLGVSSAEDEIDRKHSSIPWKVYPSNMESSGDNHLNISQSNQPQSQSTVQQGKTNTKMQNPLGGIEILLPQLTPATMPCDHVWVLEITNLANINTAHDQEATS